MSLLPSAPVNCGLNNEHCIDICLLNCRLKQEFSILWAINVYLAGPLGHLNLHYNDRLLMIWCGLYPHLNYISYNEAYFTSTAAKEIAKLYWQYLFYVIYTNEKNNYVYWRPSKYVLDISVTNKYPLWYYKLNINNFTL